MASFSTTAPALPAPRVATIDAVRAHGRASTSASAAHVDTKRWCALAIGSLVVAGLLSLAVVIGRLPLLSRIIDDPLFFKRCLVVHVDLALVVWFYSFLAGLLSLGARGGATRLRTAAHALAVVGVGAMLAGALMRGAQPVLANYVPVIDHPLFGAGLAAFFVGTLVFLLDALFAARAESEDRGESALPADAWLGLKSAAVLVAIAAATWVSAVAGLPAGVDHYTRAEFLAWGPGHVLQAANACAMLGVWLWLVGQVVNPSAVETGGRSELARDAQTLNRERARSYNKPSVPVLSPRVARIVFAAIVLPQAAMPLLTLRGTLDTLYHTGATQLMRWTIFPAVLVVLGATLWRLRAAGARGKNLSPAARAARIGFFASAALALLGMILGACIRGSTTLVPAHYHASLGAVTVAFMAAAYFVCERLRGAAAGENFWRAARRQLALFGVGQSVFALGFAIGGAYGLGRKAYAAEQHVRSAGELAGLVVMGVGGLVAAAAGLWFLFLMLREIRGWWRQRTTRGAAFPQPALP